MLIVIHKLLLDIQLTHTFMPDLIHKPWMVSINYLTLDNIGSKFAPLYIV